MKDLKVGVVIPAGGIGKRFGSDKPKQFLEINGMPILQLTIQKFQTCDAIDFIVVVSHTDFVEETQKLVYQNQFTKVKSIVVGGEHRQDSVWNGIKEILKFSVDIILIHDGVRPFVTNKLILDIINATEEYDAAVPGLAPKDTIKISDDNGFLVETPYRRLLYAVQTPQGFKTDLIVKAYEKAFYDKFYGTDDASLVEKLRRKVKLVNGDYNNIKITTVEDLNNR
ncbi:MAG: 2-C-methyl-D-erythritol 4-phosphate cytidylyltransferase [Bacteroidetes bacterium]|nr:2-C-methyl-D-erythritol 4-phosphate cytidylyltransferase [Bacteroidota bacterium]MBU1422928.1 2-C-methyl-D-erythritol 4-phosphate cytidylyltransferase [Bacteroidota bacterium]MBU2471972.1 2-C-methyl-D-erythritol 4-phosphate cytidylyltransferase [Bacteroidota bacterium]MBU2635559.1 2-C-methyl-D-erythritol 4-phosphate cytidylyltransferase [Bacteroidota bacterium]